LPKDGDHGTHQNPKRKAMISPERFPAPCWQFDHLSVNADMRSSSAQGLAALLSLKAGYRPPFPFSGHWLYQGKDAVVHVIDQATPGDGVQLNHIAFRSDKSLGEAMSEVAASGFPYRAVRIPESRVVQIFVRVSDSLLIELDIQGQDDDPPIHEYRGTDDQPQITRRSGFTSLTPATPHLGDSK
jgi:hypothetical protein